MRIYWQSSSNFMPKSTKVHFQKSQISVQNFFSGGNHYIFVNILRHGMKIICFIISQHTLHFVAAVALKRETQIKKSNIAKCKFKKIFFDSMLVNIYSFPLPHVSVCFEFELHVIEIKSHAMKMCLPASSWFFEMKTIVSQVQTVNKRNIIDILIN